MYHSFISIYVKCQRKDIKFAEVSSMSLRLHVEIWFCNFSIFVYPRINSRISLWSVLYTGEKRDIRASLKRKHNALSSSRNITGSGYFCRHNAAFNAPSPGSGSSHQGKCQRGYGIRSRRFYNGNSKPGGNRSIYVNGGRDAYKRVKANRGILSYYEGRATNSANSPLKRRRKFFESHPKHRRDIRTYQFARQYIGESR